MKGEFWKVRVAYVRESHMDNCPTVDVELIGRLWFSGTGPTVMEEAPLPRARDLFYLVPADVLEAMAQDPRS